MAERTTGGRVYLTLIGLLLAAAGGVFSWLMWRSFSRALAVERWEPVACLIVESRPEEREVDLAAGREWRFQVSYLYEWDGKSYQGDRFRLRGSSWRHEMADAEALAARYPEGEVRQCLVNPEEPGEAVLEGESRVPGYSIWFPMVFVVGGIGIIVGAWRR